MKNVTEGQRASLFRPVIRSSVLVSQLNSGDKGKGAELHFFKKLAVSRLALWSIKVLGLSSHNSKLQMLRKGLCHGNEMTPDGAL